MLKLYRTYLGYRRVGLARSDALRYAWLIATAAPRPVAARIPIRR